MDEGGGYIDLEAIGYAPYYLSFWKPICFKCVITFWGGIIVMILYETHY